MKSYLTSLILTALIGMQTMAVWAGSLSSSTQPSLAPTPIHVASQVVMTDPPEIEKAKKQSGYVMLSALGGIVLIIIGGALFETSSIFLTIAGLAAITLAFSVYILASLVFGGLRIFRKKRGKKLPENLLKKIQGIKATTVVGVVVGVFTGLFGVIATLFSLINSV